MQTIVVANGQFPCHAAPLSVLKQNNCIVATDGSYQTLLSKGIVADYWLGDMDSHNVSPHPNTEVIITPDQHRTDLAKTLQWCLTNGHSDITLIGATGLRDDHHLANLFLILRWHEQLNIKHITDTSTIIVIHGKKSFSTYPQQTVSLIAPSPDTVITTQGLQYPLTRAKLEDPTQGVSNIALSDSVTIESSHAIWAMILHTHD